jgi:hypothetical protein
LTRPARWARCSLCGRHGVPAGGVVDPVCCIAEHGVEDADHLAHDGDDGELWLFAGGDETAVKGFQPDTGLTEIEYAIGEGLTG